MSRRVRGSSGGGGAAGGIVVEGGVTEVRQPLLYRNPRMVQEYCVRDMEAFHTAKTAERAALTNQTEAEAYLADLQPRINSLFDPPAELGISAPALNAASPSPALVRTGYTVERTHIDSIQLPDGSRTVIPLNFYIPAAALIAPCPAVVVACGHDTRSKAFYQALAQGLCLRGYVVAIFDPIGQGERLQVPSQPVTEHRLVGQQLILLGWHLPGLMVWDARRVLDYVVSRNDVVDTNHIGATGTSGGGTQTIWLAARDSRITMAAPSCSVTTFLRNLKNELYADHEQMPPNLVEKNIDMVDLTIARAPRRYRVVAQEGSASETGDYFDPRGTKEIEAEAVAFYDLFGSTDYDAFYDTNSHSLDTDGEREILRAFNEATGGDPMATWPTTVNEPQPPGSPPGAFPVPGPQTNLDVLASRDVATLSNSVRSTGLLGQLANVAATARGSPSGATLITRIETALKMPDAALRLVPPDFPVWPCYSGWTNNPVASLTGTTSAIIPPNYPKPYAVVYPVESEPGILVSTYMLSSVDWQSLPPPGSGAAAFVYVSHLSSDQELSQQGREILITQTIAANPNTRFFATDVRGVGESTPIVNSPQTALLPPVSGDSYHEMQHSLLGKPYLGRMTWDVLRVCDMLVEYGYTDITLIGRGYGAPAAALAGLLHDNVSTVTLKDNPTSMDAAVREAPNGMSYAATRLLFGALLLFDWPNVYAELAATKVFTQTSPDPP